MSQTPSENAEPKSTAELHNEYEQAYHSSREAMQKLKEAYETLSNARQGSIAAAEQQTKLAEQCLRRENPATVKELQDIVCHARRQRHDGNAAYAALSSSEKIQFRIMGAVRRRFNLGRGADIPLTAGALAKKADEEIGDDDWVLLKEES